MIEQRLRELRLSRDLTQQAVADALHITRSAIGAYEHGRRTPTNDILVLLARVYETTTDYLLGVTDDPGKPLTLDPFARRIVESYQASDPAEQTFIYRQHCYIQELLHFEHR